MSTSQPTAVSEAGNDGGVPNLNRRRSSRSKKSKTPKPSERNENTSVVFGKVDSLEDFLELLEIVKSECGPVRSYFFREHQDCGFGYFHDEETAKKAKAHFMGFSFKSNTLKACSPLEYFDNELDALPIPANSNRRASLEQALAQQQQQQQQLQSQSSAPNLAPFPPPSSQRRSSHSGAVSSNGSAGPPACTLVLKNLSFGMRQERLLELMSQLQVPPMSVNYHYDQSGSFCGIAFAKYRRVEEATKALEVLSGLDVGGRQLRVEFKRRMSLGSASSFASMGPSFRNSAPSLKSLSSFGSLGSFTFSPDPVANLDTEQQVIYNELSQFKDNPNMSELTFPPNMTLTQRNHIDAMAELLGLCHMTAGPPDARFVVVSKGLAPIHETPASLPIPRYAVRHASLDASMMPSPHAISGRGQPLIPTPPHARNTWPREQFPQPRGPDGSRGFASVGRGRRVSTPALRGNGSSPPQVNSPLLALPHNHNGGATRAPPPRATSRSASVPVVVMQQGTEFA